MPRANRRIVYVTRLWRDSLRYRGFGGGRGPDIEPSPSPKLF